MDFGTRQVYRQGVVLDENKDYYKFSKKSEVVGDRINKILDNPWLNTVSLQTVITLVVEPDPNLSEDFWLNIALGDSRYTTSFVDKIYVAIDSVIVWLKG